jgi:hypothetical protein
MENGAAEHIRREAQERAELAVAKGKVGVELPGGFIVRDAGEFGPHLSILVRDEQQRAIPGHSLNYDYGAAGYPQFPGEAAIAQFALSAPQIRAFLSAG